MQVGNNLCPKMQFIEYLKKERLLKKDYFETIPLPLQGEVKYTQA